jgi:hypothetical protein
VVAEVAADNALYNREDILEHSDLLDIGFWEPSFHARFRAAGKSLELDPDLRVRHRNCYTPPQFFQQRKAHGKAFGMARAEQMPGSKRRLLIMLSPLLPILFLGKMTVAVLRHGEYGGRLFTSLPWLLYYLSAWGLGEARGYMEGGPPSGTS